MVGVLIGEVERVLVASPKEQHPGAVFEVVDGADVQGRVAGCVLTVEVCTIKQEVLEVLHELVAACLVGKRWKAVNRGFVECNWCI